MKSLIIKRSVVVAGHKTSVSLEDAFWKGLKEIAHARDLTLSELVGAIDSEREYGNLSSALRLFVLDFYRTHFLTSRRGATDRIKGLKAPGPCELDGWRKHVTDRLRIATTTVQRADASCA